ncbi:MAG: hypothetical protein OIN66_15185, partial [Candidatus Methanoperedens sp.]|nr:hypothetical protein [Candidatus Methanoperedens sp.]
DADGTNLTKIVSNEINNRSTPVELSAPPGYNPWSPSGDKIVIVVSVPRMGVIYLLANPNGDGINVLGTNFSDIISANRSKISWQRDFTWSPDGIKAVFVVTDPVNKSEKMYVADADGFNIKQLASEVNESSLGSIAWSHDGKQIVSGGNNLWIVNSDGTGLKQLGACSGGVWSPDDSKLLCKSSEGVNDQFLNHLYLIDVDSGDKTELIKSIEVETPIWNIDGSSILFKSITERRNHGIYVADLSGRNVKLIHEEGNPVERATVDAVSWNPDGSKIAFISLDNGAKLYTINPNGTGKTLLTSNLSWSWTSPYAWSPSGDKIAFSSSTANGEHVFISNPDGTERAQITTGGNKRYILSGMGGSWSPDGSRLLIESRNDMPSKDEIFIAKLSGYDRTMPIRAPENINQGKVATPQQTVDAIQEPAAIAGSPKMPGFSIIFAGIMLIVSVFFMKRWNA